MALEHPITFILPNTGITAYGYPTTILADIGDAFIQARNAGALQKSQLPLAKRYEILMRGFARIGIIGLVDEATGYQKIREKNALAKIGDQGDLPLGYRSK